jgi:hypothetical protein
MSYTKKGPGRRPTTNTLWKRADKRDGTTKLQRQLRRKASPDMGPSKFKGFRKVRVHISILYPKAFYPKTMTVWAKNVMDGMESLRRNVVLYDN